MSEPARADHPHFDPAAELRAELEASSDPTTRAIVGDALGRRLLEDAASEPLGIRELLAAFNADPTFRPPLFALVDSFERRRAVKNLLRLYEAEARSAREPSEHADALMDRVVLSALVEPDSAAKAVRAVPEAELDGASMWVVLEFLATRAGDADLVMRARRKRLETTQDPGLRTALAVDAAGRAHDADDTLELLLNAVAASPDASMPRSRLEAAARERRGFGVVAECLKRRLDSEARQEVRAALAVELSILHRSGLDDAAKALEFAKRADAQAPTDAFVTLELLAAAEGASDWDLVDATVDRLLPLAGDGTFAGVLHFRRAEAQMARGHGEAARVSLEAARSRVPASKALEAVRAGVTENGAVADHKAWLQGRAAHDATRREAVLALAHLAVTAGDAEAEATLDEACSVLTSPSLAERLDLIVLGGLSGSKRTLEFALDRPSALDDLQPLARRVWRATGIVLAMRHGLKSRAADWAAEAIADAACSGWSGEVGRAVALDAGDDTLLAKAHEHLADAAGEDKRAAHLVAAARAQARRGSPELARGLLERGLALRSEDRYARALSAALDRGPTAPSAGPLERLVEAVLDGDDAAVLRIVEDSPEVGAFGRHAALRAALRQGDSATIERTRAAAGRMVDAAVRAVRSGERDPLDALEGTPLATMASLARLGTASPAEATATLLRLGVPLPSDPFAALDGSPSAWEDLSHEDGSIESLALRLRLVTGSFDDDAFLRLVESGADATLLADSFAVALLRGEPIDLDEWLSALRGAAMQSPIAEAQRLRVQALAGRATTAELRVWAEANPTDAGVLDALRSTARVDQAWPDVAFACERLATLTRGEFRAQLLEELAAVAMDELDDPERAERACREALDIDRTREVAYARLHDLIAERGHDTELLELVSARSELFDDPERLVPLLYEQARLFRGAKQTDDALSALENLLLLDPEHLGGLALQVEIFVQLEQYEDAVSTLRTIATASAAPASQRRIARLGAAEFLEKRLHRPEEAATELEAIERELGLEDAGIRARIARLRGQPEGFVDPDAARRSRRETNPTDVEALALLVAEGADVREAAERAWHALPDESLSAASLEERARVARWAGREGSAIAVEQVLDALSGLPQPAPTPASAWRAAGNVVVAPPSGPLLDLARLVSAALTELDTSDLVTLGVQPALITPEVDCARAVVASLGLSVECYSTALEGVHSLWLQGAVGLGVGACSTRRLVFDTAFLAVGASQSLAALAARARQRGVDGVLGALAAYGEASGMPLPIPASEGTSELARSLARVAGPQAREFLQALPTADAQAYQAWAEALVDWLVRPAALCSGGLVEAIEVLGGDGTRGAAARLLRSWWTDGVLQLRREAGWSAAEDTPKELVS